MENEPVLIDTSGWIEYFNRPGADISTTIRDLVNEDRAALTGVILAELSQGARNERELSELRLALEAAIWIPATRDVYERAGKLGFELRRRGVTVPVTDCIIAAAAETIGGRVLTSDRHFESLATVATFTLLPA